MLGMPAFADSAAAFSSANGSVGGRGQLLSGMQKYTLISNIVRKVKPPCNISVVCGYGCTPFSQRSLAPILPVL